MAKISNLHADAGKFHLEIRFFDSDSAKEWEWFAFDRKKMSSAIRSGKSKTLAGAKKSAAASVGLAQAKWKPIGPESEVPEELLG
jgi:hypothetical protein